MLFDIPFVADWKQNGDNRQNQTDRSNNRENNKHVDYDYKVGDKMLIRKDGILRKAETNWTMDHNDSSLRMKLSGFNAEPNRKELISGE